MQRWTRNLHESHIISNLFISTSVRCQTADTLEKKEVWNRSVALHRANLESLVVVLLLFCWLFCFCLMQILATSPHHRLVVSRTCCRPPYTPLTLPFSCSHEAMVSHTILSDLAAIGRHCEPGGRNLVIIEIAR